MSENGARVPLYFITGFLGSGKTTLLNRILDEARERGMKIGVIINEWGRISIDSGLIQGDAVEIAELNDGQVFCSCLAGDFIEALARYAELPLDAVVVETSGMANPLPLNNVLADLERMTGNHYDFRGMTALVDPENFLDMVGVVNAVEEQVIASGRIIINKMDLAQSEAVAAIRERIAKLNKTAQVVETTQARVGGFFDFEPATVSPFAQSMAKRQVKTPYQRPGQYVIMTEATLPPDKVRDFVRALLPRALRVKGILCGPDGVWRYIDGVNDQVEDKPLAASGKESRLVVIPKAGEDLDGAIVTAWNRCCGVPFFLD